MWTYKGRTVNDVYVQLAHDVMHEGDLVHPRNTTCKELSPVSIEITDPSKRWLSSFGRPYNLSFALAEVLWILTGRGDVEMLEHYNSQITQFSDDGKTLNAAYGFRLRRAHGYDQIEDVLLTLKDDPDSRQATLVMWHEDDRGWDLRNTLVRDGTGATKFTHSQFDRRQTKDRACNFSAHVMVRNNQLNWLQLVRSNDLILGLDYNFIQFMSLQEYMAKRLGVEVGTYTHVADSMHIYLGDSYYDGNVEVEKLAPFDIYDYYDDVPPIDTDIASAGECEFAMRRGTQWPPASLANAGRFWQQAAAMYAAHGYYKAHKDAEAAMLMYQHAPHVWSAIQARFYFSQRWNKDEHREVQALLSSMYHPVVFDWIRGVQI